MANAVGEMATKPIIKQRRLMQLGNLQYPIRKKPAASLPAVVSVMPSNPGRRGNAPTLAKIAPPESTLEA
jgi:hypothetical protein